MKKVKNKFLKTKNLKKIWKEDPLLNNGSVVYSTSRQYRLRIVEQIRKQALKFFQQFFKTDGKRIAKQIAKIFDIEWNMRQEI